MAELCTFDQMISSSPAMQKVLVYFQRYDWPGNIRELKSLMKIGMVLIQREHMWLEDLPLKGQVVREESAAPGPVVSRPAAEGSALGDVERDHIRRILQDCQWKKSRACGYRGRDRAVEFR